MIFVTVGTHEQQFNRLIKAVDLLKEQGIVDDIIVQTGYSTYVPKNCEHKDFFSYQEMNDYMQKADIIITHGGPSTFMSVLAQGKVPIVVPRLKKYGEHVNDHQMQFVEKLVEYKYPIKLIKNIVDLSKELSVYELNGPIISNNDNFNNLLDKLIIDKVNRGG